MVVEQHLITLDELEVVVEQHQYDVIIMYVIDEREVVDTIDTVDDEVELECVIDIDERLMTDDDVVDEDLTMVVMLQTVDDEVVVLGVLLLEVEAHIRIVYDETERVELLIFVTHRTEVIK